MVTVESLVASNLQGAQVRQFKVTEEDGGTLERAGIVIWRRDNGEWGTHRFVINQELDEGALVWGHYFPPTPGYEPSAAAYKDYLARIEEDI